MSARKQIFPFIFSTLAVVLASCGAVTQTADDCTRDQFFDAANALCRVCPALEVPECPADCGVGLTTDARGCLSAACTCDLCPEGELFDEDRSLCTACPDPEGLSCGEGCVQVGQSLDERGCAQPACDCDQPAPPCPEPAQPACGDEGCCAVEEALGPDGCATLTCACPAEAPEGFFLDDEGQCLRCPEEGGPAACAGGA
jgi:hypothetical protein